MLQHINRLGPAARAATAVLCSLPAMALLGCDKLMEGSEAISGSNGYEVVDTGSSTTLMYRDKVGRTEVVFLPDVRGFKMVGGQLFVARVPFRSQETDGHYELVPDGAYRCEFWRIDTATRAMTRVTQDESHLKC
jgi:hypothetical protein